MGEFLQVVASLREQMQANLSRSDVLKALIWPLGILMSAMLVAIATKAPAWVLIFFAVLLALKTLLYAGAYLFCLMVDRDALRSEKYSLDKLAIESGLYGDSKTGLLDVTPRGSPSSTEAEQGVARIEDSSSSSVKS